MDFGIYEDKEKRKKELWRIGKSKWQIIKINSGQAWRRFDIKTKGMGLWFVMFFGIMMLTIIIPAIGRAVEEQLDNTKYAESLKTACLKDMFYALNFKTCENIGVRP